MVPFPNTADGKWAISEGGGVSPVWSRSGRELFYRDADGALVAVRVETEPTFSRGGSTILFAASEYTLGGLHPMFDVAPGDQRFLMIRRIDAGDEEPSGRLILVQNFVEELRARVPK